MARTYLISHTQYQKKKTIYLALKWREPIYLFFTCPQTPGSIGAKTSKSHSKSQRVKTYRTLNDTCFNRL